ncbi:MAG: DUF1614 domain-containing protein [Bacillota bacterium]|nr:DUF1614 domain-containing protein [Bacillota bacterium]
MTIGLLLLVAVVALTVAGLAHRVFDRLHLTDAQALIFLLLLIGGSFLTIPLYRGNFTVALNVGGGILPIALAVYVLTRAGTGREWSHALLAAVVTGAFLYGTAKVLRNFGHGYDVIDPMWVFGLVAGIVGYVAGGRSRRTAFIGATLGVLLLDVANLVELATTRSPGRIVVGGAGAFDTIVVAGVVAVLLAEVLGETREKLGGGPVTEGERPPGLYERNLKGGEDEEEKGGGEG